MLKSLYAVTKIDSMIPVIWCTAQHWDPPNRVEARCTEYYIF